VNKKPSILPDQVSSLHLTILSFRTFVVVHVFRRVLIYWTVGRLWQRKFPFSNERIVLRAARDNIKREVPLKSMLTPTSSPIAHALLDSHDLQIITARIKVTAPSNRS
jgi:hypothetical protein